MSGGAASVGVKRNDVPSLHGSTQMIGGEPNFTGVCSNESDRMILRNIVYTIWAMNKDPSTNCYMVSCHCMAGYG